MAGFRLDVRTGAIERVELTRLEIAGLTERRVKQAAVAADMAARAQKRQDDLKALETAEIEEMRQIIKRLID